VNAGDTIVACASGWARSIRAIVRVSGPGVPEVLRTAFGPGVEVPPAPSIAGARLRLRTTGGEELLPCLVLAYPAPRSYTGEHAAEMLVPGNPRLVERVIARLVSFEGVREATPGEFTARAFLNGKLTLDEAEGVGATIAARSADDLDAARRLKRGDTGRRYRAWREECSILLALVEAGIDFSDQEDVVPIAATELRRRIETLREGIRSHLGSARGAEAAGEESRVAIAGRPNAGKSTLFNALLRRRRAVVSPVAGTTRDVLAEPLDLSTEIPGGGVRVMLLDLAGLDSSAHGEIDAAAQHQALEALAGADVVVHCDPAGRFREALAGRVGRPVIRVHTKADLPAGLTSEGAGTIAVCALDGWNLGVLRRAIADAAWAREGGGSGAGAVLPRHRRALADAAGHLGSAAGALGEGRAIGAPEMVAGSLRASLDALGEVAGRVSPDDVIGRIFSTFCIGK
jgi:tRNA modification GTPase